jgi:hypothetical protein
MTGTRFDMVLPEVPGGEGFPGVGLGRDPGRMAAKSSAGPWSLGWPSSPSLFLRRNI